MIKIFLVIFVFVIQFYPVKIFPQVSLIINDIKNYVGDTIDVAEREFYEFFPNLSGFQSAVFQERPDGFLDFRIRIVSSHSLKDSLFLKVCTAKYFLEAIENSERKREIETKNFDEGPVTILLKNGKLISGKLLSVNYKEIHFKGQGNNYEEKGTIVSEKLILKEEIRKILIRGDSYKLKGAGIGLASGVVVGLILAELFSSSGGSGFTIHLSISETAPVTCTIFGIIGTLIGIIIGNANSEEDLLINVDQYFNLTELQKYCSVN